ncbi:hypothetical protein D3H65_06070 [Paraflavitalea soli]|uniref:Uncharacterized protein n=1 Tax=Paraflavitalea soli TaxID=2315862 RepID=A0A3B7MGR8_9BACT|nr:hypothetical protein [Paraflavitalea soli]AXY73572.1 hypothetical protein D3H65_06070 [Paraflavitalea soli]
MSPLLWTILAIVAAIAGFFIYRIIVLKNGRRKLYQQRFERVQPLYDKLESGQALTADEVYEYAKNLQTRETTFLLLNDHNMTDLFPREFYTIEKAAASNLVNWLEYPTELDACPDELEHLKRVTIDFDGQNNFVHYEVFRYRVNPPHWAAEDGWILGVVGPYFDDSQPYDHPSNTFSRISSKADMVTPEEEVKWVHENLSMRR